MNDLENLTREELEKKIKNLQNKLKLLKDKKFYDYIDDYIDKWYDNNKEEVDLGIVKICGIFKVDLIPDELEKHMYKKIFKIIYSLIMDLNQ